MTGPATPARPARRVRLSLEAAAESRAAVRLAAELAQALDADLDAVFLEDEDVLALAALPVAREVLSGSGVRRAVSLAQLEADMRAKAAAARKLIEQASRAAGLHWEFRTARGSLAASLTAEIRPRDVIVLAASALGERRRGTLGEAIRRAAREAQADIILSAVSGRAALPVRAPILVAEDGTPGAEAAASLARRIARRSGAPVIRLGPEIRSSTALAGEVRRLSGGMLLVSAGSAVIASGEDLERLAIAARCSVLMVGAGEDAGAGGES